jgi:transglutaminase-like putative cysteine protease
MTPFVVRHVTAYQYERPMSTSQMIGHLVPRTTTTQRVESCEITTDPGAAHRRTHVDAFGNLVSYMSFDDPHERLVVTADSVVEVDDPEAPTADISTGEAIALLDQRPAEHDELAHWCRLASPMVPLSDELRDYAAPSFPPDGGVVAGLRELSARIFRDFEFDPHATDVATPIHEVLGLRRGVCQDFAHLAVGSVRSMGLPARYVSGYLETSAPPGYTKLVGADASHAWCSVYVPGLGWLDADPTNDAVPPDRHVTVAWARDYSDVAPLRGVTFGPPSAQTLTVSVDVIRLDHPQR